MPKIKGIILNMLLLIFVSLVCIILAEIFLNIFLPQDFQTTYIKKGAKDGFDPQIGYTKIKNSTGRIRSMEYDNIFQLNEEGFTDDNWPKKSKKRIAIVDDSFVEAINIRKELRFSDLLEKKLDEYDVLNFGVGGFGTCNEYLTIKNKVMKHDPDIVMLVVYTGNDFDDNLLDVPNVPKCDFNGNGELVELRMPKRVEIAAPKPKSQLFGLSMNLIRYSRVSYHISNILFGEPYFGKVAIIDLRRAEENIEKINHGLNIIKGIKKFLDKEDVEFVLVILPDLLQVEDDTWQVIVNKYAYDESDFDRLFPNRIISEFALNEGIEFIDLYYALNESSERVYFSLDRHLNEKGHEIVADEFYEYFEGIID